MTLGCDKRYHPAEYYNEFVEQELVTNKTTGEELSMAMVEGNMHADHDYDDNIIYSGEYQHYVELMVEIKRERIDQAKKSEGEAKKDGK